LVRAYPFWFSTNKARRSVLLLAEKIAYKISKAGYGVLPAAALDYGSGNKGAHLGGGTSVGLNIVLPFEQHFNPYIDGDKT
jgi:predicted Rossmann-fold nucleotide-binding protein